MGFLRIRGIAEAGRHGDGETSPCPRVSPSPRQSLWLLRLGRGGLLFQLNDELFDLLRITRIRFVLQEKL